MLMSAGESSDQICHLISRPPFTIHHFDSLGSTNDYLKQLHDAPEFTCITADAQTAGRGRRDRSWHSAPEEGLYLSVLLCPGLPAEKNGLLSLMCAVAIAETIENFKISGLDIKWPNDVLIDSRKVSGVLIESSSDGSGALRAVVGIGINLNHQQFPAELVETATSLRMASGRKIDADELRDQLLVRLADWYEKLRYGRHRSIIDRWQELSSYASGRKVLVTFDNEMLSGITDGITENGALRLLTESGEPRIIFAGEIHRLR
jgi:BirA family biotin operon repressor/biotin-[acetyl-CoA-carboxylase] ligase